MVNRLFIDRADLPLLQRVFASVGQAFLLLGAVDIEIVFDDFHIRLRQHLLEDRHRAQKLVILGLRAEAHDMLHTGAVIPAAVEDHDFPRRRQMRDIALKIPLCGLYVGWLRQRHDADVPRGEMLGNALDGAVLPRAVAAFQDDEDFLPARDDVPLELYQLHLQAVQTLIVILLLGHERDIGAGGRKDQTRTLRRMFADYKAFIAHAGRPPTARRQHSQTRLSSPSKRQVK